MSNAKKMAFAGIGTALGVILMYLSAVLPINNLTFIAAAGFVTGIILMYTNYPNAWVSFCATALLCWFFVPQKQYVLAYILLFGWYGITKCYIEFKFKPIMQWLIKIIIFNMSAYLLYFIATAFWTTVFSQKLPLPIIWIVANIAFVLYDIAFGLAATYIQKRIKGGF